MEQYYYFDGRQINIGDRVMCVVNHPDDNLKLHVGDLGTVRVFTDCGYYRPIGVEWDNKIEDGHNLWTGKENAEDEHGWWMLEKEIYTLAPVGQAQFEPAEQAEIYAMLGMK